MIKLEYVQPDSMYSGTTVAWTFAILSVGSFLALVLRLENVFPVYRQLASLPAWTYSVERLARWFLAWASVLYGVSSLLVLYAGLYPATVSFLVLGWLFVWIHKRSGAAGGAVDDTEQELTRFQLLSVTTDRQYEQLAESIEGHSDTDILPENVASPVYIGMAVCWLTVSSLFVVTGELEMFGSVSRFSFAALICLSGFPVGVAVLGAPSPPIELPED